MRFPYAPGRTVARPAWLLQLGPHCFRRLAFQTDALHRYAASLRQSDLHNWLELQWETLTFWVPNPRSPTELACFLQMFQEPCRSPKCMAFRESFCEVLILRVQAFGNGQNLE